MGTAHPTKTSEREAKGGKRAAVKQTTGDPPLRSDAAKGAAEDTRSRLPLPEIAIVAPPRAHSRRDVEATGAPEIANPLLRVGQFLVMPSRPADLAP